MGHPYCGWAWKHLQSLLTFWSTAATSAPHPGKISSFPREETSKKKWTCFFAVVVQRIYSMMVRMPQSVCRDYGLLIQALMKISLRSYPKVLFSDQCHNNTCNLMRKMNVYRPSEEGCHKMPGIMTQAFLFQVTKRYYHLHKVWKLVSHCAFNDKGISWFGNLSNSSGGWALKWCLNWMVGKMFSRASSISFMFWVLSSSG